MNFERINLSKVMFVECKEKGLAFRAHARHEHFNLGYEEKSFSPLAQKRAARGIALSERRAWSRVFHDRREQNTLRRNDQRAGAWACSGL